MVEPTLSGNYPRDERLIRATWTYDKGLSDAETLRSAQLAAARDVVRLQQEIGCREVTDGQFAWQDLLRPVSEATEGIDVGGLVRFHETNTFLRRPVLKKAFGPDEFDGAAFLQYTFTELWTNLDRPKAVLPSPYFFLRMSEGQAFDSEAEAGEAIGRVINRAAQAAARAGAAVVQFNDPTVLHEEDADVDLARRLLGIATKDLEAETVYYPYAGDAAPHWDALTTFPCHRIGVDFLETELDELGELPTSKSLLAGVIDSRSSVIEPETVLREFLARVGNRFDARSVQATHSYDLDFVPPEVAQRKLKALAAACSLKEVAQ